MKTILRIVLVIVAAAAVAACASDPADVSGGDLKKIRAGASNVHVGMTKQAALDAYPKGNKVRLSSSSFEGTAVEEWKIEAYADDDWNKSRDLFITFLYFADDKLVDMSDSRLPYRESPELVNRWVGGSAGAAPEPMEDEEADE
jgi:hypothetical protein